MSEDKNGPSIEDGKSLSENLEGFSEFLTGLDAELAAVLTLELSKMASGQEVDRSKLLDALYEATEHPEGGAK